MMDQTWFEMPEVRKRKLNSAVWIPLRASQELEAVGHRAIAVFARNISAPDRLRSHSTGRLTVSV
jgi:hypothetical protein